MNRNYDLLEKINIDKINQLCLITAPRRAGKTRFLVEVLRSQLDKCSNILIIGPQKPIVEEVLNRSNDLKKSKKIKTLSGLSRNPDQIRGINYDFFVIEEAEYVSQNTMEATVPLLLRENVPGIIIGSPKKVYYNKEEDSDLSVFRGLSSDCYFKNLIDQYPYCEKYSFGPAFDREFLSEEKHYYTDWEFRSELLGEWICLNKEGVEFWKI